MEAISSAWTDLGALGLLVVGLAYAALYSAKLIITMFRSSQDNMKKLEEDFRNYLMDEAAQNRTIIQQSIEINAQLVSAIYKLNDSLIENNNSVEYQNEIMQEWIARKKQ